MHKLAKHYGLTPRAFSPPMMEACQAYSWPGNLRELEAFVKRYLMTGDKEQGLEKGQPDPAPKNGTVTQPRTLNQLPPSLIQSFGAATGPDSLRSLVQSVKLEAERHAIASALEKTGWNRKAAARLLKISYRTLLYKIDQYQIRSSDLSPFPGGTGIQR
jgi:two-component system, NtrC family, response regulator AtoC